MIYEALRAAGHDMVVIGLEAGALLRGKRGEELLRTDRGIAHVYSSDFDAPLVTSRQPGDVDAFSRASLTVRGHASAAHAQRHGDTRTRSA
jgi:hypothetical protein